MADNNGDAVATQRAIGRLEGRLDTLATQHTNLENTTDRRLNAVAKELSRLREDLGDRVDGLAAKLGSAEIEDATRDGRFRGSYLTLVLIATVLASVASLAVQIIALFHR